MYVDRNEPVEVMIRRIEDDFFGKKKGFVPSKSAPVAKYPALAAFSLAHIQSLDETRKVSEEGGDMN